MSGVTDILTGIGIHRGDPIVGLVVAPARGGYPDADVAKARTGGLFADQFRIASLPIRGVYEDFGSMTPDNNGMGAHLAVKMTGLRDFQEFQDKASEFREGGGVGILGQSLMARLHGETRPPEKRILGFAYMHASSWERLTNLHPPEAQDRPAEVARVAAAMRELLQAVSGPDKDDQALYSAITLFDLQASGYDLGQGRIELPRLAGAFSGMEDAPYDPEFARWVSNGSGLLGLRSLQRGDPAMPHLEALLTDISDTMAFANAMAWHNKMLAPSTWAGRDRDSTHAMETALLAMEQASGPLLEAISDNGEGYRGTARLASLLNRLETFRVRVEGDMLAAMEGNYTPPAQGR